MRDPARQLIRDISCASCKARRFTHSPGLRHDAVCIHSTQPTTFDTLHLRHKTLQGSMHDESHVAMGVRRSVLTIQYTQRFKHDALHMASCKRHFAHRILTHNMQDATRKL
eukprot:5360595-Pyramimonas_sp.AAC.1